MNTAVAVASLASAKAVAAPAISPVAVDIATASAATHPAQMQDPDPIFALIERHRAALILYMEKARVVAHMNSIKGGPKYQTAVEEQDSAAIAEDAVSEELAGAVPSTPSGALALLAYVDDLCAQRIVLPADPKNWHSSHERLGDYCQDDIVSPFDGAQIGLPLFFWVMRNVRATLEASGAAGLPIGVVPALPAPRSTMPDEKLFQMESAALVLHDGLKSASDAFDDVENVMKAWHKKNPEPSEKGQLARWKKDERKALRHCGYAEKETDYTSRIVSFDKFLRHSAKIRAASIGGLQCKARLVELSNGSAEELLDSISSDLLAMGTI